jgi:hypothetical protein
MSWWGRLWAAPEAISKSVDAVIATGDKLVLTEEEKRDWDLRVMKLTIDFHEKSQGSNMARRIIAIEFVTVFLLLVLTAAVLTLVGFSKQAAAILTLTSETLVTPISIIVAFYFTIQAIRVGKGG